MDRVSSVTWARIDCWASSPTVHSVPLASQHNNGAVQKSPTATLVRYSEYQHFKVLNEYLKRNYTTMLLCVTVVCVPGTYREGNNPGQCVPCPNGYYRNSTQDNCTACGDLSQWRTADVGADDASKCLCK